MENNGKSATDFILTYGLGIVGVMVAIGVLAYFGVFSSGDYITGAAVVNPPFYLDAWSVQQDSNTALAGDQSGITLDIKNNDHEIYTIYNVEIEGCGRYNEMTEVNGDQLVNVVVPCSAELDGVGETFEGHITVVYRRKGSNVDLTSTGSISEKIN